MSDELSAAEKVVEEFFIDLITESHVGVRIIYRSPNIVHEKTPGLPFHCSHRSIPVDR
jgi:hypothetical protein